MGAVLHTINPRLPLDQLRYVVDHAEDVVLFFDTTFLKLAQFLAAQANPLQHYVALTDAAHLPADSGIPELRDYEGLIAGEPETFDLAGRSTSTRRRRSATPRAPPASRRACSIRTDRR